MKLDRLQPRLKLDRTAGALCVVCGDRFGVVDHDVIRPTSLSAMLCMDCRVAKGAELLARNRQAPWTQGQTIPDDSLMLMPVTAQVTR